MPEYSTKLNNKDAEQITLQSLYFEKKVIVSYVLSILVFFIHYPSFSNYIGLFDGADKLCESCTFWVRQWITPLAIPLFFIISGYTFYRDFGYHNYCSKIKRRVHSLLFPYIAWNIIWMIFTAIQIYVFHLLGMSTAERNGLRINIFLSIFHHQNNGPFWFVFDLIIFSLCSPVLYSFLRNKWLCSIVLITYLLLMKFGLGLPEQVFYRSDALLYYLIGAIYGIYFKDLFSIRTRGLLILVYGLSFVVCLIISYLVGYEKMGKFPLAKALWLYAFTISFWHLMDLLTNHIKPKRFMTRSFMIYAMHVNVSVYMSKALLLLLPKSVLGFIFNSILTLIGTLMVINFISNKLENKLPNIYSILSGHR